MGQTAELAAYIAKLSWDDLPASLIKKAKAHLLDTLGVALGGSLTDHVRQAATVVRNLGGEPQSTAIGQTFRTNALEAAFLGGTCAHSIEFDDTGQYAHTGAGVIPGAVSLGEARHVDGKTLILAIVAGYELTARVSAAAGLAHRGRGYHPTGTCGVFGATAVGAKILGLNAKQTEGAFGTAASHASAITQYRCDGGPTKHIHPGIAGRSGLLSALMAEANFAGTAEAFEGKYGFLNIFSDGGDPDALTRNLGTEFGLTSSDIRPYPCCRQIHAPADLVLDMVHKHGVTPDNIDTIDLYVPAYSVSHDWLINTDPPASKLNAILSMPYCLAAAFIDGEITLRQFEDNRVGDQKIHDLARKVHTREDPEMTKVFPLHRRARLEVMLKDGQKHVLDIDDPRGSIQNPLPFEDVAAKFRDLAGAVIDDAALDGMSACIENLEDLADVGELAQLTAAKESPALKSAG
ncbi:MAG: MmgE/PrpD family protein [Rhodospirillales bacterium]